MSLSGSYPTSPMPAQQGLIYPSDLNVNGNFYITLQLATYDRSSLYDSPNLIPGASITLPLPVKINDVQTLTWSSASVTSAAASEASNALNALTRGLKVVRAGIDIVKGIANATGDLASSITGMTINPYLVMLFKQQNFKQHNLQWILAPNSAQDSQNLDQIVKLLKNSSLPSKHPGTAGMVLDYPTLVIPFLSVENYTMSFKPCGIQSISIDWSAGGSLAFFNNQAPAVVSLSLQLEEIELWFAGEVV